jgi:hypothetical protein
MLEKVVHFILGRWFFVAYFSLGAINFVVSWLSLTTMTCAKSFFITLGLMTGSDPYSFKDLIEPYLSVWILAWLIHIASWLLIPALIGLLVNDAAQDIKRQQGLRMALGSFLQAAGARKEDLPHLTATLHRELDAMIRESYRKEEGV